MRLCTRLLGLVFVFVIAGPAAAQFSLLHEFSGFSDGTQPSFALTAVGSTLFGVTPGGGDFGSGTIYTINADGSGYTQLHAFRLSPTDGYVPTSALTVGGSTLYGSTYLGGSQNQGIIYKLDTSGAGFSIVHSFTGGNNGSVSLGGLAVSGPLSMEPPAAGSKGVASCSRSTPTAPTLLRCIRSPIAMGGIQTASCFRGRPCLEPRRVMAARSSN